MEEDNEGKELEVIHDTQPAPIETDSILAMAAVAQERVRALKQLQTAALQITHKTDWIDQQGRPYLTRNGADRLARAFGVSYKHKKAPHRVEEEEGHYRYECIIEASDSQRSIEIVGARSSKDPFFSVRYKWEDGKRVQYDLRPPQIDEVDIMKACQTNGIGRAILSFLGLNDVAWEMIESAGMDVEGIKKDQSVKYQQSSESSDSKDIRTEIREKILEMADGDSTKASAILEELTSFIPKGKTEADRVKGKTKVDRLTEKQLAPTLGRVKEAYTKWKKQGEMSGSPEDLENAIRGADTVEECDSLLQKVRDCGIKGDKLKHLCTITNQRKQVLKGELL
jgi:hypothetical protein